MINLTGSATTRQRHGIFSTLVLTFLISSCLANRAFPSRKRGFCNEKTLYLTQKYPTQEILIPIDHFHNESRYEPHSEGYYSNRWWFDDTYYKPGGPVIVENSGEDSGVQTLVDLEIGLLHELAVATNGIAVVFEHRYYGSNPIPVHYLEDFRFLSVEQALADQAYFAQNVVFPGHDGTNLTAPNTPYFALGGSYPGTITAFERIQYPDLFWGAIASSAPVVFKDNYWEYNDIVRRYSPQDCVDLFGKILVVADNILLGDNQTEITQLKSMFRYIDTVNGSNYAFANQWLNFPFSLQSVTWLPCLEHFDGIRACRVLTSSELLYPQVKMFEGMIEGWFEKSRFASEADVLTTAFLNYIGDESGYQKHNDTSSVDAERRSADTRRDLSIRSLDPRNSKGQRLEYGESYLAFSYQQCTELGLFQTADAPPADTLPIISRLQTLHFLKDTYCREQLGIPLNETSISTYVNNLGGYLLTYPRLMFTGGEWDPWRGSTALATRDTPTRLNTSSTPESPWYLIPKLGHITDLDGVYPSQVKPGVPPPGIITAHKLEKDAIVRWLGEWHEAHPDYDVKAR